MPRSPRSADQPDNGSLTPAWAGNVGSISMEHPQNTINASASNGPIVNLNIYPSGSHQGDNQSTASVSILEPATTRADHEIYYHQLLTKKRGSPLWVPGPGMQLPVEYRREGISIGDVGIITSTGEFDFLFNIFQSANHPINIGFVPRAFSPLPRDQLERDTQKTRVYGANTYLASSSVRKTAVQSTARSWFRTTPPADQTFESASGEAAVLTMPDGASTQNLLTTLQILQCISENAQNWYEYARNERSRAVKNGDIRVVIGVDKVKSWGIATSTCSAGHTASLTFKPNRGLDRVRYRWDCTGGSGRVGPEEIEINDLIQNNTRPQNQCVFVRTMNFTLSGDIGYDFSSQGVAQPVGPVAGQGGSMSANRGRSEGHTSREPGASSSRQTSSTLGTSSSVTFGPMQHGIDYHPSAVLHAYLHKKFPTARMVITQDSDWISVLNDNDMTFPELDELVGRILKSSYASERDGIVTMCMTPDYPDRVNPQVQPQIATVPDIATPDLLERQRTSIDNQIQSQDHAQEAIAPRPSRRPLLFAKHHHPAGGVSSSTSSGKGTEIASTSSSEIRIQSQDHAPETITPRPSRRPIIFEQRHPARGSSSPTSFDKGTEIASTSSSKTMQQRGGESGVERLVLRGHTGSINSVVFSPDGRRIASASSDRTVRLWDSRSGAELAVLLGHLDSVNSVVFSPDGTKIASASSDKTVLLWDAQAGMQISVLRGHWGSVNSAVFSPDGTKVASASSDETVLLWDAQAGTRINVLREHWDSVNSVAFSPDGAKIASASSDETVLLWDAQSGAKMTLLRKHSDSVNSVVFSPDGTKIASASSDQTVRLWDARTGKQITVIQGQLGSINSVTFSPDGTTIASASSDKMVRLWDSQTGAKTATGVSRRHLNSVISAVFSPRGREIASASSDQTIRLWDVPGDTDP